MNNNSFLKLLVQSKLRALLLILKILINLIVKKINNKWTKISVKFSQKKLFFFPLRAEIFFRKLKSKAINIIAKT